MDKQTFFAITILMGNIIGAGVLGIPYVVSRSGLVPGLIMLAVISIPMIMMYFCVGEITLRHKAVCQLAGMYKFYFKNNKLLVKLAIISMFMSMGSAITAYITGAGSVLSGLLGGLDAKVYSFIFFLVVSLIVLRGLKTVGRFEAVLSTSLFILIVSLSIYCIFGIKTENLTAVSTKVSDLFFPYGVILFACLGFSIIPQMEKQLIKQKHNLKKAITIGFFTCVGLYAIFMFSFVGKYGINVQQIAIESLEYPYKIIGEILVLAAMTSPFLAIGIVLRDSMMEDFGLGKLTAWFIACWIPYFVTLLSPTFIDILSVSGTYFGGIDGIMVCIMFLKARKMKEEKPAFTAPFGTKAVYFIAVFFILGMIYQTLSLLKVF